MSKSKAKPKLSKKRPKTKEAAIASRVAARIASWRKGRSRKDDKVAIECGCTTGVLDLTGMGLQAFPDEIRQLDGLEALNLNHNKIEEMPSWIGELTSLRVIGLGDNRIRSVPEINFVTAFVERTPS
jgi:Leucine-rich repeat (LRR) protein